MELGQHVDGAWGRILAECRRSQCGISVESGQCVDGVNVESGQCVGGVNVESGQCVIFHCH